MGLQITPMAGLCLLMFLSYPLPPPLFLTPGSADNAFGRTLLILVLGPLPPPLLLPLPLPLPQSPIPNVLYRTGHRDHFFLLNKGLSGRSLMRTSASIDSFPMTYCRSTFPP